MYSWSWTLNTTTNVQFYCLLSCRWLDGQRFLVCPQRRRRTGSRHQDDALVFLVVLLAQLVVCFLCGWKCWYGGGQHRYRFQQRFSVDFVFRNFSGWHGRDKIVRNQTQPTQFSKTKIKLCTKTAHKHKRRGYMGVVRTSTNGGWAEFPNHGSVFNVNFRVGVFQKLVHPGYFLGQAFFVGKHSYKFDPAALFVAQHVPYGRVQFFGGIVFGKIHNGFFGQM